MPKIVGSVATVNLWGPPPENHPVYAMIGRVVSGWSHVEHVLDLIIWELSGGEERKVAASTAQMNGPSPRFKAILKLLEVHQFRDTALLKKITDLRCACTTTADFRNRIVHDAWYVDRAAPNPVTGKRRSMRKEDLRFGKIVPIDDAHFQMILAKIGRRLNEVHDLRAAILQLLASRGKGR